MTVVFPIFSGTSILQSIRQHGAKYGLQIRQQGPRRPALSSDIFRRPDTVPEEEDSSEGSRSPVPATLRTPGASPANITNTTLRPSLPPRSDDDDSNRSSQVRARGTPYQTR